MLNAKMTLVKQCLVIEINVSDRGGCPSKAWLDCVKHVKSVDLSWEDRYIIVEWESGGQMENGR